MVKIVLIVKMILLRMNSLKESKEEINKSHTNSIIFYYSINLNNIKIKIIIFAESTLDYTIINTTINTTISTTISTTIT